MHRWPSVQHFCRWLGLCPQHTISGGKVLSRRVRPGAHRVAVALRLAARTVQHARTALGAFYRRMRRRLGAPKAITATAHKLARLVYSLLKHGSAYVQCSKVSTPTRARTANARSRPWPAKRRPWATPSWPWAPPRSRTSTLSQHQPPELAQTGAPGPVGERGTCLHTPARCPPADPILHATHPPHPATPSTRAGLVPWEPGPPGESLGPTATADTVLDLPTPPSGCMLPAEESLQWRARWAGHD